MKVGFGRRRRGLGGPAVGLAVTVRRGSGSVFGAEASFGKLWGRARECRYFQVILMCGCEVVARTVLENIFGNCFFLLGIIFIFVAQHKASALWLWLHATWVVDATSQLLRTRVGSPPPLNLAHGRRYTTAVAF